MLPPEGELAAGSDATGARLWPVAEVVGGPLPPAFDNLQVVTDAEDHTARRLQDRELATAFVGRRE